MVIGEAFRTVISSRIPFAVNFLLEQEADLFANLSKTARSLSHARLFVGKKSSLSGSSLSRDVALSAPVCTSPKPYYSLPRCVARSAAALSQNRPRICFSRADVGVPRSNEYFTMNSFNVSVFLSFRSL